MTRNGRVQPAIMELTIKRAATLVTVCLLFTIGCESPITVRISRGPSFEFGGSTDLLTFTVFGPQAGKRIANFFDPAGVIWEIQAPEGDLTKKSPRDITLVYGHVPTGFVQIEPPPRRAPQMLSPGHIYAFWARAKDSRMRTGFFYAGEGV